MRCTRNICGMHQGQICIVDYTTLTDKLVEVFVAPDMDLINGETMHSREYLSWRKLSVKISPGHILSFNGDSLRRTQFPLVNYVAMTIHKLMGDTFRLLATAISQSEKKFSLWPISQLYVIVSRVCFLRHLYFVGNKIETLNAIRHILQKRNLIEERLFNFFQALQRSESSASGPTEIETPQYLTRHLIVPETDHGFCFMLVSLKDKSYKTFHVSHTDKSLSEQLRILNSTEVQSMYLYTNQPWAVGFFFWCFKSSAERKHVFQLMKGIQVKETELDYNLFKQKCHDALCEFPHLKMIVCGNITDTTD